MTLARAVQAYGEHAVLLDCDPVDVAGWSVTARELFPQALDVVPGAASVVVDGVDPATAIQLLSAAAPGQVPPGEAQMVEIAVSYDGPDLDTVAAAWGCAPEEVASRHQQVDFTVAFCGFAPGFAYLSGLPEAWAVPRRSTPRSRVPAGSVAVAGRYSAIYPTASPGGWQLIGHTEATLWSLDQDPPALLAPGTKVRFVHD